MATSLWPIGYDLYKLSMEGKLIKTRLTFLVPLKLPQNTTQSLLNGYSVQDDKLYLWESQGQEEKYTRSLR